MERQLSFIKPTRSAREDMIQHIGAVNKHLTKEYLENLSNRELLCETHPAYREDYSKALGVDPVNGRTRILKMSVE